MTAVVRIRIMIGVAAGLALSVAAISASAQGAAKGDPVKGKQVFALCSGCHVLTGDSYGGPALAGVVGRKAGGVAGFSYSDALKASGIVWTDKTLDSFLADPSKAVPGTAMFANVPDAQDRADVIAYLKTVPATPTP